MTYFATDKTKPAEAEPGGGNNEPFSGSAHLNRQASPGFTMEQLSSTPTLRPLSGEHNGGQARFAPASPGRSSIILPIPTDDCPESPGSVFASTPSDKQSGKELPQVDTVTLLI